jgi:putative ABC transport system permease protein
MNLKWLIVMAWRDSRKNRGRLLLFMSSIMLGIAALVAIQSFGDNLRNQVVSEAKALLGADIEIESRQPLSDTITSLLDSLGLITSKEVNFASMVQFLPDSGTRLVNVRAVEATYPFYGALETLPAAAGKTFYANQQSVVENTLMIQYGAKAGDSIAIGNLHFGIAGNVIKVPGQSGIAATVAPPVFMPYSMVKQTGLLQKGSRLNYRTYVKYPEGFDVKLYETIIKPALDKEELSYDDVEERKQEVGEAYSDLASFLNLTAFIALLLGCIGVASSVHIYMKEKVQMVALLRCLGASGKTGMGIFMVQILLMGLIGASMGAALGTAVQFLLPKVFAGLLPVEVQPSVSWNAILQGIGTGVLAAVLFALFPLLGIRKISPLKAIRSSFENPVSDPWRYVAFLGVAMFIVGFAWMQLGTLKNAIFFSLGILVAFGLLAAFAQLIIWMVRRFLPVGGSFTWRHGLSNLYRPNNQTLILVITIGLGTALITTLLLSQQLLLDKVKFSSAESTRPNMVIFDIQDSQVDEVKKLTEENGLPMMGLVPIITMRLHAINGRTAEDLNADTTIEMSRGLLNREYRVTYRDTLIDSETLLEGEWRGRVAKAGDSIFISLDKGIAESMKIKLGDPIVWNVQGALVTTYAGSFRKIDFQRVQTNFLVLFPAGVLEIAPKFHVQLTRFDDATQSAKFQQRLVGQFPNVSVIDLNLVLETVDEILSKVSFVIRFMAFFSIITGILVLIGSVIISKYQRIQESVLLRTMGASRRQIAGINTVEYFLLGSLSAFTGIFIALMASWVLAKYSFNTILVPQPIPLIIGFVSITGITLLIGLLNSREVVNKPPLEILRKEA